MAPKYASNQKPSKRDRSRREPGASAPTHSVSGEPQACPVPPPAGNVRTAVDDSAGLTPGATKPSQPSELSRQSQVRIAEALRANGYGEERFAEEMGGLVGRVSKQDQEPKLQLDVYKEWSRHLAPVRPAERSGCANEASVTVQLIHLVPRPERNGP